uniref:Uncharacterized protein n=1 Tax=Romanomermis culicivorax TaxID=13658 RepID=A0A915JDL1_ROMCU
MLTTSCVALNINLIGSRGNMQCGMRIYNQKTLCALEYLRDETWRNTVFERILLLVETTNFLILQILKFLILNQQNSTNFVLIDKAKRIWLSKIERFRPLFVFDSRLFLNSSDDLKLLLMRRCRRLVDTCSYGRLIDGKRGVAEDDASDAEIVADAATPESLVDGVLVRNALPALTCSGAEDVDGIFGNEDSAIEPKKQREVMASRAFRLKNFCKFSVSKNIVKRNQIVEDKIYSELQMKENWNQET